MTKRKQGVIAVKYIIIIMTYSLLLSLISILEKGLKNDHIT